MTYPSREYAARLAGYAANTPTRPAHRVSVPSFFVPAVRKTISSPVEEITSAITADAKFGATP